MSVGLRPDGTGQLLCVLAAVGWSGHSRLAWLTGSICGAAAPLVMPFTATLILPLLAWHLGCAGHEPTGRFDWSGFCQRLLLAAAAGVFVFLLLVLALDSRISDFIRVFTLHARLRAATGEAQWGRLLASMCTGWEPLLRWPSLLVLATGLAGALCTANGRRRALFVAAIFTGFIVLGALLYTGYLVYLIYLAAWISAGFLIPVLPRRMSHLLLPAWGLAAGLLVLPSVVDVLWARTPPIDAPALRRAVADSLAAGNRRLLLDEFAARYVYDWQLPPGAEDWLHCHRPPARPLDPIRIANKPQGDLWLVDAAKLERHVGATGVITPKIKIGRHLSSMPLHPGDIRLIK